VEPGGAIEWSPVIGSGLEIRGKVLDAGGAPLARWGVRAHDTTGETMDSIAATTGEDGTFRLRSVGSILYVVTARDPHAKDGFPRARAEGVRAGDDVELRVTGEWDPSAHIDGRLLDSDGRPVGHAEVRTFARLAVYVQEVTTDAATGRFRVGPLPPGEYRVEIVPPDHARLELPWRPLAARETWDLGELHLEPSGRLLLRIVRENGCPDRDPSISIQPEDGPGHARLNRWGDGWRSDPLPAGRHRLRVGGEGFAGFERIVDVASGAENSVELMLRPGSRTTLRFRAATGAAEWKTLSFRVVRETGEDVLTWKPFATFARTAIDWAVDLGPGSYRLFAADDVGRTAEAQLRVDGGTRQEPVEIELR
jgi:carboxypeptidase family protein